MYDDAGKLKYTIAPGARAANVAAGTYKLKVEGADGVELDTEEFTMKRNGKAVVRVTAKPDAPAAAVKDADRRAAEWVLSVGGQVLVWNGAEHRWIDTVAALPRDPFPLWAPRFKNLSEVTDDKLAVFKECTLVKQLDLPHTPVTDAGLAHFARCKGLEYISLNGKGITDKGLAHLTGLSNLTSIQLRGTRVTDAGLVHFGGCKRLQYLDLANTNVTDTGLAHFRECVELERVLLEGTTVTDAGLAQFAACRELHVLGIADTRTTSAALKPFAKCNFTDLNVTGTAFDDTGFAHVANSPRLQNLVLQKTQVTAAGVTAFAKAHPHCRIVWDGGTIAPASDPDRRAAEWVLSVGGTLEVTANGARGPVASKEQLPAGPFQVVSVTLSRNGKATDAGLAAFAGCKHVRELYIDHTSLGSGLEHFATCTELGVLAAQRSSVRDAHLAHLKNCTKLKVVSFASCGVTDTGLAHLAGAKGLVDLNLSETGVTNAGLARFAECPDLACLGLARTKITDAGLEPFRARTGFELLLLEGLPLTDAVLEMVAKNEKLAYLNLNASQITDTGVARLRNLTRLNELYLGKAPVTKDGGAALAKALPNCKIVWDGGTVVPSAAPAGAVTGRAEFPTYTRIAQIGTHDRRHRAHIEHLDAVPQWNRIATVAPDGLKVWELSTLKLVAEVVRLDEKQPLPAACALVGPNAVAVLDRDGATGLTVYDVSQRPAKVLRRLTIEPSNFPRDRAASPNREWVAFAHNEQVELWKPADLLAESGKPAHLISGEPTDKDFSWRRDMMRFAPDGTRFAFKIAEAVRTFALANGRWAEGATVPTEGSFVSFVFGPRNESLLVSYLSERHKARVCEQWDVTEKKPKQLAAQPVTVNGWPSLSVLDDGHLLLSDLEARVLPLPLKPGAQPELLKMEFRYGSLFELRPVGGGAFVARDGAQVRRFRAANGKLEEELAEPFSANEFGRSSGGTGNIHFAAGRVAMVCAESRLLVRVWGIDGPQPKLLFEAPDTAHGMRHVVLSNDGKEVFIGGNNEPPQIWAVGAGREPLVRFWNSARHHVPLGLSDDGKFALTHKGRAVYVWDRSDTNQPIFEHKLADTQWPMRAHARQGGWLVPVRDFTPAHQLVPLTINTNNGKPAARTGAPLACDTFDAAAPVATALALRYERDKAQTFRFVIADLDKNPPAEREVKLPAELQTRFAHFRSPSLSPDGSRAAVLSLDDRTGYVGFVAVVDLNTGKLLWEHKFGGEVVSAEYVGPNRLMILHRNGVIEVVEPKLAAPK